MLIEHQEQNKNIRRFKMFKMINKAGKLTKTARDMFQGARIQGGANEMIVFPGAFADSYRMKRIAGLMDSINL